MSRLVAFEDPNHPGNSLAYHTGKPCAEKGCDKPAGTKWGKELCFGHNVERIKRIDAQFEALAATTPAQRTTPHVEGSRNERRVRRPHEVL